MGRTSCTICIQAYEGVGKETPCATCKPELKRVNVPYFVLYDYCQDQLIVGPGGAISLDMNAIHRGMKDYEVDPEERIEFSQQVRRIARVIINARHEEAEAERARNAKTR